MLHSVDADDYMSVNPVTFTVDTDIFDAIHLLLQRKLSGGTVIDEENNVVGVLSEMDCLKAIINTTYYHEGGGRVGEFMTAESETLPSHLNLVDAAQALLRSGRRRMPVVDGTKFIGQISARSILQAFKDTMAEHDATEDELTR